MFFNNDLDIPQFVNVVFWWLCIDANQILFVGSNSGHAEKSLTHHAMLMQDQQLQLDALMGNLCLSKLLVLSVCWFLKISGSSSVKVLTQSNLMIPWAVQFFLQMWNHVLHAVWSLRKWQA